WCTSITIWCRAIRCWKTCWSAGAAGAALMLVGMAVSLASSLWASRRSATGDQARSAFWAAVAAVGGATLLVGGGLSVPSAMVAAGMVWALTPHMMAHRVRRFHGLAVVAVFFVALVVLGLEQMQAPTVWRHLAVRYGDGAMHFFGTFVLTGVFFWQIRSGRWWQAVACAVAACALASAGEIAQRYLSTRAAQWSDVLWNSLGAAVALGGILLIYGVRWIERILTPAAKMSTDKYDPVHYIPGYRRHSA
ncbi:hypothetical protein LCGC14_1548550, partial [marine sediment metagenome]